MDDRPLFRWETLLEGGPHVLAYARPVPGMVMTVDLTSGTAIRVFRADDGQFYFCHGLTFGGKEAPGGPVSPFSGKDVRTILDNHYRLVELESSAAAGDILVWIGPAGETPHSAILTDPVVSVGKTFLDYNSV